MNETTHEPMIVMPSVFDSLLQAKGLNSLREAILKAAKPSLRLFITPVEAETTVERLASRFGGRANLLPDVAWPTGNNGQPLTFLGQINLADIAPYLQQFPAQGLLSFFYDVKNKPWGNFEEREGWRVFFAAAPEQTVVASLPTNDDLPVLPLCQVEMRPEMTLPAPRSIELNKLPLTDDLWEPYLDLRNELLDWLDPDLTTHRIGGHPDAIQGCMQRIIQFESRNEKLPPNVYSYYEHPRAAELMPGAFGWHLLLQIDSSKALGQMWSDNGRIFYWIHQDNLAREDFSNVWLKLQSH